STGFDVQLVSVVTSTSGGLDGLTANQRSVGEALLDDFADGALEGDLQMLAMAVFSSSDVSTMGALLEELTPQIANSGLDIMRARQDSFRQSLLADGDTSPPTRSVRSRTRGSQIGGSGFGYGQGGSSGYNERRLFSGARLWGSFGYDRQSNGNRANEIGYISDGLSYSIGVSDVEIGLLRLGLAGSYSDYDATEQRGFADSSDGRLWQIGAVAGAVFGGTGIRGRVDLAATYSDARQDIRKVLPSNVSGISGSQSGRVDVNSFGATMRLALNGAGRWTWPVRPFVSLGYDHVRQGAASLSGGGGASLLIERSRYDRFTLGYGARFEQEFGRGTAMWLSAGGYHHFGDTQGRLSSRFTAQGTEAPSFITTGQAIRHEGRVDGGVSVGFGGGWSIAAEGHAEFGNITGYGARVRLSKSF
ncbi:MAG: autotransporter outer membrane beta-barrel domain-containing protein, partial [Proteobacteria bacterium]|nr:autotransporter outer membrane beta-barrel domain-containing protein [Pseudomonadota bacterium]